MEGVSYRGVVTDVGEPSLPGWKDYNLLTIKNGNFITLIDMDKVLSVSFEQEKSI